VDDGIGFTPQLQPAAHLIAQQINAEIQDEAEVWAALGHCPQCGSGHFTEFRVGQTP
jgi:formate dehydrogenase maturation protein FdhE